MLKRLWTACSPLFDSASKIEFFGRLANAAQRQIDSAGKDEDARPLLRAVLAEAGAILDEMEDGTLVWLEFAPGGVLRYDLKE
jgi:hypothetical protein